jgi:hypothetical protein
MPLHVTIKSQFESVAMILHQYIQMILQILADTWQGMFKRNTDISEVHRIADTRQLQQLR